MRLEKIVPQVRDDLGNLGLVGQELESDVRVRLLPFSEQAHDAASIGAFAYRDQRHDLDDAARAPSGEVIAFPEEPDQRMSMGVIESNAHRRRRGRFSPSLGGDAQPERFDPQIVGPPGLVVQHGDTRPLCLVERQERLARPRLPMNERVQVSRSFAPAAAPGFAIRSRALQQQQPCQNIDYAGRQWNHEGRDPNRLLRNAQHTAAAPP